MAVQPNLLSSHSEKTLGAMKAERTVKRITFNPSEANPGETLYVSVPKLSGHEVIVSGSLALVFNIVLTGGHANNYLVQNVSRALVHKLHVKFGAESVQDTDGYDIYKIFEDLFLSVEERDNMISEGIQSVDLCKIRSGAGDKKTTGVDAENKPESIYKNKYRINLDHQILTHHGVIYPQALYNDLVFELTLAQASQVVRGSDANKLVYKLENIQLEYETIRSKSLADEATSTYTNGKEFAYDLVRRDRVVPVKKGEDTRLNIGVNHQRRSLKGILLLSINPFVAGAKDSGNYFNPDITKVKVTVNGVPNRVYNEGISGADMWNELTRFFNPPARGSPNMNLTKYLTGNKFGLFIDLRSMADTTLHGNGQRLVNTHDGVQLKIERNASGSGTTNFHIFTISDSQMNSRVSSRTRSTKNLLLNSRGASSHIWSSHCVTPMELSITSECASRELLKTKKHIYCPRHPPAGCWRPPAQTS